MRHERGQGAHARSRGCGLAAGVPAANNDHIETLIHVARYLMEPPRAVKKVRIPPGQFHVKRRSLKRLSQESGLESEKVNALFTDAEIAKYLVQDVLDVHPTRQSAKRLSGNA